MINWVLFKLQTWAALFLYKTKESVVIGCKVNGDLTYKTRRQFMYGIDLSGRVYLNDGREFHPPSGRYKVTIPSVK